MRSLLLAALSLSLSPQEPPEAPPSRVIEAHADDVNVLVASSDGKYVVTASATEIRCHDAKKGKLRWTHDTRVPTAGLSVGDDLVAFHQGFAAVSILELKSGDEETGVASLAITERCTGMVLTGNDDWVWFGLGTADVVGVKSGDVHQQKRCSTDNASVTALAVDGKGKRLAVGGSDGTVRFVSTGKAKLDERHVCEGHGGPVTAVVLDPKGSVAVSSTASGDVRVWKVSKGEQLHRLDRHEANVDQLAIGPKGKLLATGDVDGIVHLWDLEEGEHLLQLPGLGGRTQGLAFAEGGRTLATSASSPNVTLWDLSDL